MEIVVSSLLWETLSISLAFSVLLMAVMQKIKMLPYFKNDMSIWLVNLGLAFLLGIPFSITFYYKVLNQGSMILSLWVSFLGFVGAPAIYEALKAQKLVNYKPKSRRVLQKLDDSTKEETSEENNHG